MARLQSIDDVFINCPFDQKYAPVFHAFVFGVHACGFRPRTTKEIDDAGQLRLEKIFNLISQCRYGIHELSRTELDQLNNLPRFNMPLELGLFLGAKRFGGVDQRQKRVLILDVEEYRYQAFISDLAGMDIHAHGGDPERALAEARDWLANVSRRKLPSSAKVLRLYREFQEILPAICAGLEFEPDKIPYVDYEGIVVTWLLEARPAS